MRLKACAKICTFRLFLINNNVFNTRWYLRSIEPSELVFGVDYHPSAVFWYQKSHLQNFDASSIPPCAAELRPQFLRSMYIARLWSHAHKKIPTFLVPEDCGWVIINSKYQFRWFDGPQIPSSVKDVVIDQEQSEADINEIESEDDIDCESEEDMQYDESDANSEIE
ncbi:uncharacterized protein [Temnothorax nylanderi]|uniref:uncharacterized protein n=1 Tax=Temnothorax nylanderi TaxID=102681 RepID=UPI003A86587A